MGDGVLRGECSGYAIRRSRSMCMLGILAVEDSFRSGDEGWTQKDSPLARVDLKILWKRQIEKEKMIMARVEHSTCGNEEKETADY